MSNNTKLLCLFLKAQKIDKSSEQGYAMAMVSMVSIVMLSLLAASMTFSNLAKSRTSGFVDTMSSFNVAESGLNKRASEFKAKLVASYTGVQGVSVDDLTKCFKIPIPANSSKSLQTKTNDFECRNYSFESSNNAYQVAAGGSVSLNSNGQDKNKYIAYTAISGGKSPQFISIPKDDDYGGLNAAEYTYKISSTAKKPIDSEGAVLPEYTAEEVAAAGRANAGRPNQGDDALMASFNSKQSIAEGNTAGKASEKSSSNLDLSMTFVNRVVPLFQFGVFYNGDLEFNSTSKMQMQGWVHSNANIYVQPAGETGKAVDSVTTFLGKVTATGSIYNRVDAFWSPTENLGIGRTGITKVLLTGTNCDIPSNCLDLPQDSTGASTIAALTTGQIDTFKFQNVKKVENGIATLNTPIPGFTRKRSYRDNTIGLYYAQADMRLEMVPDRDLSGAKKTTTPWTRNQAIIPFNFISIKTVADNTTTACSTTIPSPGQDPVANYIDPKRENVSNLKCHTFTKGQLQSLRQPVLVLTSLNQTPALVASENKIFETLGKPTLLPTPPTLNPLSEADGKVRSRKILRALQVALVSTPTPIPLDKLNIRFDDPAYDTGSLNTFELEFKRLLEGIFTTTSEKADLNILLSKSPNEIAALQGAWFLPAPIQRVETTTPSASIPDPTRNLRSSGFYDGREQRWISMLQTNIASLSVWNRDGLYVDDAVDDTTLTTPYATNNVKKDIAFASGTGANSANGFAFDRSPVDATRTLASELLPNLQSLGLGSIDQTEGGLVFYAGVSDNLNGDSTINVLGNTSAPNTTPNISAGNDTNDVTLDTANPIYKKNSDGSDYQDPALPTTVTERRVVIDYYRKYPGLAARKSPFGFAFNGGNYLPGALLVSSDQSVYLQGNYNNDIAAQPTTPSTPNVPSKDRFPASVIADTITALSNECISTNSSQGNTNFLAVPAGQIKCGLPRSTTGSVSVTGNGDTATYDSVATPVAINAAFLSNTDISKGNQGRTLNAGENPYYSGGVNNYIRLLENWGSNSLNYTGSLISLGTPLEYSGAYRRGGLSDSYYDVPFRNFNYDPFFTRMDKIPPLTPKASYTLQRSFGRVN
jgi:Tfp pilus assembly protein PilX